jgi:queuine tRNA-ribosyltransferase
MCFDECPALPASKDKLQKSVELTLRWAKRCKEVELKSHQHLFGIVQGGLHQDLRKYCLDKLHEIGFHGYGFGGYMIDENGDLDLDISKKLAEMIPNDTFKFALGVGDPYQVVKCLDYGWEIFDCTLPTRDARHKRLYIFNKEISKKEDLENKDFFSYLYLGKDRFIDSSAKISEFCDCQHLGRSGTSLTTLIAVVQQLPGLICQTVSTGIEREWPDCRSG